VIYLDSNIKLIQGDCLEVMKDIEIGSIDLVLCDPPYGTTVCKWDTVIDLDKMWEQLKRVIKPNGAIVMTASQPFTSALIMSNVKMFKYEIIWEKDSPTNPFMAKLQIMKRHENICVFYNKQPIFKPQMEERKEENKRNNNPKNKYQTGTKGRAILQRQNIGNNDYVYPKSIQKFTRGKRGLHPTQKPVALMEYLIKTYTNENDTVLDFTMGSGTTGVACKNLNRKFIGIEKDINYFNIAKNRIENTTNLKIDVGDIFG
jgi:site-specific DNA-methyltransferase (adenine-specific)